MRQDLSPEPPAAPRPREDADAVREQHVPRLPLLLTFKPRLRNGIVGVPDLELAVILEEKLVGFELVLDVRDVDAGLEGGVGADDDEGILLGFFKGKEYGQNERSPSRLRTAAKADDRA